MLLSIHAESDKWDTMIKVAESCVTIKKSDGSGVTTLEVHIERCKGAYIEMKAAADRVSHDVAGQYTRVKRLITSIGGCKDPGIQAVISIINNHANNLHDGMTGACLLLLPDCPIVK